MAFDPSDILTDLNKEKLNNSLAECTQEGRALVLVGATERLTSSTILDFISGLLAGWYLVPLLPFCFARGDNVPNASSTKWRFQCLPAYKSVSLHIRAFHQSYQCFRFASVHAGCCCCYPFVLVVCSRSKGGVDRKWNLCHPKLSGI